MENSFFLQEKWEIKPLDKCVDILDKFRVPINSRQREKRILGKSESELYPYFGATGQTGWIDDYIFDEELVLLGEDGAPFLDGNKDKAYIVKGKFWVNNHAHVLRGKDGVISNSFLMHYLNYFNFQGHVTGTTRLKLNQTRMKSIPLLVPPIDVQEQIVEKIEQLFSQLDAGVAGLKRAQAELKRYRASVLKAAFEGRLVPQDPNDEPVEVLIKCIDKDKSESNDKFPDGWVLWKLDNLSESIQYGYTKSSTKDKVGPKILRITDIQDGSVNWDDVPFCEIDDEKLGKYQLYSGDIVFARTGATTGKSFLIDKCPKSVFASYLIRIKLKDIVFPQYCYLFFQSPMYWGQIMITKKGSTQPGVNASILSKLEVPLPPLNEQKRIVDETNRLLSIMNNLESSINRQINLSEKMRASILKSAFQGKLSSHKENQNSKED